jgi:hypothetical protein
MNPAPPRQTLAVDAKVSDLKVEDLEKNRSFPMHTTNSNDPDSENSEGSESDNSEGSDNSDDSENLASSKGKLSKSSSSTLRIEEIVTLADLEKAEEYRNENTLRRLVDGKYQLYSVFSTTTSMLGEYGAGLELYFVFIKQMGFLFILISLLSAWPIYQNSQGGGLVRGAAKQEWSYWTVANQKQISLKTLNDAENDLKLISQNRIVMAIADSIGALCFAFFFVRYFYISKRTVAENFKNNVTAADYAIEIKGIPENTLGTEQIKEHFEQFGEVVEVYLARKYFGMLNDYRERAQISNKLGYERIIAPALGYTNTKTIKNLEEKICRFDTEMHIRCKSGDILHEKLPVNRAYLIFNKLENKKLCLEGCAARSVCCKKRRIEIERLFKGEIPLKVKQTTEPSNILWENLEITRCERRWRKSLSFILALAVLVGSTVLVYVIKTYETTLPSDNYCLKVKKIDTNASLSFAKEHYKSQDESYCFCKYQEWTDIVEDKDLGSYCSYFMTKITTSLVLKFFSACGIIFINFILRMIFKKLSRFERVSNKTKEEHNIMIKVFFAIFINTALIILIVNANFSRISAIYKIPGSSDIFTGKYADFTREWYINIGESIIFTILICVISPHILTFLTLYPFWICKRRLCYKRYKTQSELNTVFAGPQFDLACRNSQVLNLVFTSYLYSSAMPFLNIVTMVALFCLYWTDKYLVLRHYKKPPLLSYHLNDAAIKFIPFIIIMHCSFGIYMFGCEDIFPTKVYEKDGDVYVRKNGISNRIISIPGAVHSFVIFLTIFFAVMIYFYSGIFNKCRSRGAKVEAETQDSQGTYIDELETIKKHGLHTYEILENLDYKNLILSLNCAAGNVQTLRNTLTKRTLHMERLQNNGK